MVAGRTTEGRTIAALTKTSGSAAVTAAAGTFSQEDVGRSVTGTGIQAATTVLSVQSGTAATLSLTANASNAAAATLGQALGSSAGYYGWSPETVTENNAYSVTSVNAATVPPDRIVDNYNPMPAQRSRG